MSKTTKNKHVIREALEASWGLPSQDEEIVRVLGGRGNYLVEVERASGERCLASLPSRFRHVLWVKQGDFVLVQPIAEGKSVRAELCAVLLPQRVRFIKKEGMWPSEFGGGAKEEEEEEEKAGLANGGESDESEEDDSDLFVNTNRVAVNVYGSEEEDDSEEDDSEEEDDDGETVQKD